MKIMVAVAGLAVLASTAAHAEVSRGQVENYISQIEIRDWDRIRPNTDDLANLARAYREEEAHNKRVFPAEHRYDVTDRVVAIIERDIALFQKSKPNCKSPYVTYSYLRDWSVEFICRDGIWIWDFETNTVYRGESVQRRLDELFEQVPDLVIEHRNKR